MTHILQFASLVSMFVQKNLDLAKTLLRGSSHDLDILEKKVKYFDEHENKKAWNDREEEIEYLLDHEKSWKLLFLDIFDEIDLRKLLHKYAKEYLKKTVFCQQKEQ